MKAPDLIILGGGPAALALAFYARQAGKTFLIIEKENVVGGNATTFNHNEFLFDSGAHRWHNIYPEITTDIQELLGEKLRVVTAPSSIFLKGKRIAFPLRPLNLLFSLGPLKSAAVLGSFTLKSFSSGNAENFTGTVVRRFGRVLSEMFLIPYTQKLWGKDPGQLTSEVAGKRLKGFGLKSVLGKSDEHLDGAFYYPTRGIGMIFSEILKLLPPDSILTNAPIRKIVLEDGRVKAIELSGETIDANDSLVVSTLAPNTILELSGLNTYENLSFRHVILVFLSIRKNQLSDDASVYFPSPDIPFTRVVEPKVRSSEMSPEGMTSLVLEIPISPGDHLFKASDEEITSQVLPHVLNIFSLRADDVGETTVKRLLNAYPVLTASAIPDREKYYAEVTRIRNLSLLGRNASHSYLHLHDLFARAKELVSGL